MYTQAHMHTYTHPHMTRLYFKTLKVLYTSITISKHRKMFKTLHTLKNIRTFYFSYGKYFAIYITLTKVQNKYSCAYLEENHCINKLLTTNN